MYLKISVLFVILGVIIAEEKNSFCVTPNGENGTCISVNSCRPIKQAIQYLNQEAIEFAKNSQCGYSDEDGALVCCGSVGRVTSFTTTAPLPPIPTRPPPPAIPVDNYLLPDLSLCGVHIAENRTKKGNITVMTEFPWVVALKYTKDNRNSYEFLCSGTLINQRYVLTAAECLNIPGFNLTEVRLGEWKFSTKDCIINLHENTCDDPVIDLKIIQAISHPYYNNRSHNNNVALLFLEKDVKYNDYIRPICLPPSDYPPPPATTRMEISGWNILRSGKRSDIKLKSTIRLVETEDCNKVYPNHTRFYPNKACLGGRKNKNPCNSDSGSPLMRTYDRKYETEEEQWFQEGIVYKVAGCEEKNYIGLYTRVSRYLYWILNNINKP